MNMVLGQLSPIGAGPVATVHSGVHAGAAVAVKVLQARLDRRTLSAFERERDRLAAADSAAILPVRGVEPLPDRRHALWMELCTQSLATLVGRVGPLTVPDVTVLGHALAAALAAAHAAGVVHGGVSPNNALFRASGEPVLADFGVVLRYALARDPMHAIEFQAPETVRDQTLDERTDLYGLGATLHFALTGRAPHPGRLGERPGERVLRVLRSPVPAISRADVPVELSTLVARMLGTDPDRRPGTAAAVAERFAGMLGLRPSAPVPPPPPPDPPAPAEAGGTGTDTKAGGDPEAAQPEAAQPEAARPEAAQPEPAPDPSAVDGRPPDPGPDGLPPAGQRSPALSARSGRAGRAGRRLAVAAVAVSAALVTALVLLLRSRPDELTTTPRTPPPPAPSAASVSAPATAVRLELAEPADLGDHVVLTWTAAAQNLDFAVIVAPVGESADTLFAGRVRTMRVPVEPNRGYCFRIRATDMLQVYDSRPRAVRGAVCQP
jgi:serine/threonine protein kinase